MVNYQKLKKASNDQLSSIKDQMPSNSQESNDKQGSIVKIKKQVSKIKSQMTNNSQLSKLKIKGKQWPTFKSQTKSALEFQD
jgi:uncharacterized protein YxjI